MKNAIMNPTGAQVGVSLLLLWIPFCWPLTLYIVLRYATGHRSANPPAEVPQAWGREAVPTPVATAVESPVPASSASTADTSPAVEEAPIPAVTASADPVGPSPQVEHEPRRSADVAVSPFTRTQASIGLGLLALILLVLILPGAISLGGDFFHQWEEGQAVQAAQQAVDACVERMAAEPPPYLSSWPEHCAGGPDITPATYHAALYSRRQGCLPELLESDIHAWWGRCWLNPNWDQNP